MPNDLLNPPEETTGNDLFEPARNFFGTVPQAVKDPAFYQIMAGLNPEMVANVMEGLRNAHLGKSIGENMDQSNQNMKNMLLSGDPNAMANYGGAFVPGGAIGQVAYHASPHIFDSFSLEHIGKGQGDQIYSQGMYFAGHPQTMEGYYKMFEHDPEVGEAYAYAADIPEHNEMLDWHLPADKQEPSVIEGLKKAGVYDPAPKPRSHAYKFGGSNVWRAKDPETNKTRTFLTEDEANAYVEAQGKAPMTGKDLYHRAAVLFDHARDPKANVPQPIRDFLNSEEGRRLEGTHTDDNSIRWAQRMASAYLNSLGVPGVRYIDSLTRRLPKEHQKYNYSVWNENRINDVQRAYTPEELFSQLKVK